MPGIVERLPIIIRELVESGHYELIRKYASDPEMNKGGSYSSSLANHLRRLGAADYLLKRDVASFRARLAESAALWEKLFERFERGELRDADRLTLLCYQQVFDALAAGDLRLGRSIARHMQGIPPRVREDVHPFDRAMGYALCAFVLDEAEQMRRWSERMAEQCAKKRSRSWLGYAEVFAAMRDGSLEAADRGFRTLVEGHKRLSRRGAVFGDTVDEALCIWGVGLANLARWRGLRVEASPPLIPADLLVDPSEPSALGAD